MSCLSPAESVYVTQTHTQHQRLTLGISCCSVQGMGWESQCGSDLRHLLHTLQHLPLNPSQAASQVAPLTALCSTRFAAVPSQPPSSLTLGASDQRPRHLHRSLTESDASSGRRRDQLKIGTPSSKQDLAGKQAVSPAAQDRRALQSAELDEAGGSQPSNSLENGHASGVNSNHVAALGLPADGTDEAILPAMQSTDVEGVTVDSAPEDQQQAQTSNGMVHQEHDSSQQSAAPDDSDSRPVGDEVQQAAAALQEAAVQDVHTADDGNIDMVATSSAMLDAAASTAPQVLANVSIHDPRSESTSSLADETSPQPAQLPS